MRKLLVALFLATTTHAYGQAIWTGPPGGGMLGVQEPTVAKAGHGAFGIVLDNYDRDPWGLDINELRTSFRVGVGHQTELYGSWIFSRAVVIPGGQHPAPPSPMDVIVASGSLPTPPFRPIYWPLPYTGKRSSAPEDMIPGDVSIGLKRELATQRGHAPALSLSTTLIVPTSRSLRNLHRGSGSATVDGTAHIAAGWSFGRWMIAANLGYIMSGATSPNNDDLIISHRGIKRIQLERPDFIRIAAGTRYRLSSHVSFMAEVFHLDAVTNRTATKDDVGATDILLGAQIDVWHFTASAGYRQHLWPPRNDMARMTGSLAGAVDLTDVSEAERSAYLAAIGSPLHGRRPDASLVVTGAPPDTPFPSGAYQLPTTYLTSTTGNGGVVLLIAWKF